MTWQHTSYAISLFITSLLAGGAGQLRVEKSIATRGIGAFALNCATVLMRTINRGLLS